MREGDFKGLRNKTAQAIRVESMEHVKTIKTIFHSLLSQL